MYHACRRRYMTVCVYHGRSKNVTVALALSSGLLRARVSDLGLPYGTVFESEAGGD